MSGNFWGNISRTHRGFFSFLLPGCSREKGGGHLEQAAGSLRFISHPSPALRQDDVNIDTLSYSGIKSVLLEK